MHFLLFLSVVITIFTSLLLTLSFENRKIYAAFCIFISVLFSEVVLIYEFLSLFSSVTPYNVLILNILFLLIAIFIYRKNQTVLLFKEDLKKEYNLIKLEIRRDKWLKISLISFLVFIVGSIIYMYFMPSNDGDALAYHVARLPFWYSQSNINHFECSDVRALIMPINSEIFYFWAYSFIKSDIFVRFFSFISYILFAIGLKGLFNEIKFSTKTYLWTILSITAMQNVMFSISATETNLTISALIVSSLYLFLSGIKEKKYANIFFSSLLYALAIGTKTPAIHAIPAIFIIMTIFAIKERGKEAYKYILTFAAFLMINFLIFASYNYILNFIDFGNPVSSVHAVEKHKLYGGFKGFIANIIRYFGLFIDTSGLPFSVQFWRIKSAIISIFLALINIQPDTGVVISEESMFKFGNNYECMCGLGILGMIVFIPSLFISLKRIKHSKKTLYCGIFAVGFLINILCISATLGYFPLNIRYIVFFVLISSPVIASVFIVKKNSLFKKFVSVVIIYSLTISYYFYERRYSPFLFSMFVKSKTIVNFKNYIRCDMYDFHSKSQACYLYDAVKNDDSNILYFAPSDSDIFYLKDKDNHNDKINIDFKLLETTEENEIDWHKYKYIIVPDNQINSNIKQIEKYKNALLSYNDGSDGNMSYYDFAPELFANCIFVNNRINNFNWIKEDKNKIINSYCYFKPDIFEKHGFKKIATIVDKNQNIKTFIYKN